MKNIKFERIDSEIQRELSLLLRYDVKDPRVTQAMVIVSGVNTTADLKYAKVFVSIMAEDKKVVLKALQAGAGFFRKELASRLRIRTVPEITFVLDESFEYGLKIDKILKDIVPSSSEDTLTDTSQEEQNKE
ncbi:MAG: 30S ribosome-binding factor RbfA [Clostridia bacterium]|nr:30S ribosome-binding factor RbfA [Clostridia bacterium]